MRKPTSLLRHLAVIPTLFLLLLIFGAKPVSAARIFFPDRAYATSNYVYVAIGVDGGGSIYRYNPATKKKKLIASGKYHSLTVKGSYIYCGLNKYSGSDESSEYIYKISTNGKAVHQLANGMGPVLVGNKIYYLQTSKVVRYNTLVDDELMGIYRMNLDGSGKEKVADCSTWTDRFGTDKKYLYYYDRGKEAWKRISLSTGDISDTTLSGRAVSSSLGEYIPSGTVTYGKTKYDYSGKYIYRTVSGKRKRIAKMGGSVKLLTAYRNYLFVVTEKTVTNNGSTLQKYYATVMTTAGKKKKVVATGYDVSGGW